MSGMHLSAKQALDRIHSRVQQDNCESEEDEEVDDDEDQEAEDDEEEQKNKDSNQMVFSGIL